MDFNQEQLQHRLDVQKQQFHGMSPRELQKLLVGPKTSDLYEPRPGSPQKWRNLPARVIHSKNSWWLRAEASRGQLKRPGGREPTCEEQLENNQDAPSYQPITPMDMPHQVLPPESPQTPLKPDQPTEMSDRLLKTTRNGRVVKKISRFIEHSSYILIRTLRTFRAFQWSR